MTTWLDPVRRALDAAGTPATIFFRDDDGGWENDRLLRLLDRFMRVGVPIDLAVIPAAVDTGLAARLRSLSDSEPDRIRFHQHGYAHANHEPSGRRCEFGPSRPFHRQLEDIRLGRRRLLERIGEPLDPIFTPPWNRCTWATADALVELGFRVLSRDEGADPLQVRNLVEQPVGMDWFARRKTVRVPRQAWAAALAARLARPTPVGVMLHHALMDAAELESLNDLLTLLATHASVQTVSLAEAARLAPRAGHADDAERAAGRCPC